MTAAVELDTVRVVVRDSLAVGWKEAAKDRVARDPAEGAVRVG